MPDENKVVIADVSELPEDIAPLYLNEQFSDVAFIVEGKKLHAHKAILAGRSEYFKNLLSQNLESDIKIDNASSSAFSLLLKFIYTGNINVSPSDVKLALEVTHLVQQSAITDLASRLSKKIQLELTLENVIAILNIANKQNLDDISEACYLLLDQHASEILTNGSFKELTQVSLVKLLERDTFCIAEVEIFKGVLEWRNANNDYYNSVLRGIRLSQLTATEIVSIVRPTGLFCAEVLLEAVAEILGAKPITTTPRAQKLVDVNIATPGRKAEVLYRTNAAFILNGTGKIKKYVTQTLGDQNGITIKLGNPSYINHIQMMETIEVSKDQTKWKRIIDYTQCPCKSYQNLYFEEEIVQYIRVMGTYNTANKWFQLILFETYYKSEIPRVVNGFVCPTTNVASLQKKAAVIEGENPTVLLDGDTENYDGRNGYTHHGIGSGAIVVQLAQPNFKSETFIVG